MEMRDHFALDALEKISWKIVQLGCIRWMETPE
jgi:hypothetical protein